MSVLTALSSYYDRLADKGEVPPFGYARTRVGFCIILGLDGVPVVPPVDLRERFGKRLVSPRFALPTPLAQRTSGISPNFLWDKTAYALGVTAGAARRTIEEHTAFVDFHIAALKNTTDDGLVAFRKFVEAWSPREFESRCWPPELVDQNVVFALDSEYRDRFLHQRSAARGLWDEIMGSEPAAEAVCLATGRRGRIARSHPPIKGVEGAQSSGAFIVSANAPAFVSYAPAAGDNAPVSELAAFAYTTILNLNLENDNRESIRIGDASIIFWAESENPENVSVAEGFIGHFLGLPIDEEMQANRIRPILKAISKGLPLSEIDLELAEGVRFYILGLSPNAARLSVRFWHEGRFGTIADNIGLHARDLKIEPWQWSGLPSADSVTLITVPASAKKKSRREQRKMIPRQLAGELLRAILSGGRYPATLLSTLLMRLRADGDVSALRVAMLKAIVARNRRLDALSTTEEPPVSLDPDCKDPGYLLGRLFAAYERAQLAALGRNVNATVKDKYYGAASSTPQTVFPLLDRGAAPHIAKLRKVRPGMAVVVEKEIGEIMDRLSPGGDPFPRALPPAQQALFALGYYHQRAKHFEKRSDGEIVVDEEGGHQ